MIVSAGPIKPLFSGSPDESLKGLTAARLVGGRELFRSSTMRLHEDVADFDESFWQSFPIEMKGQHCRNSLWVRRCPIGPQPETVG